jgi:Nuclease-related domain.
MPRVFGTAGAHSVCQSARAFKRMFLLMILVAATAAFFEGILLAILIVTRGRIGALAVLTLVVGIYLWWFFRYAGRRFTTFERERLNWRKGAVGEWEVEAELQQLPEQFFVFHNLNTGRGNFDHIVVGPTGVFALETKNWIGLIAADEEGELMLNGQQIEQPCVKKLVRRIMLLHEQISALIHSNEFYLRGLMVFPSAHVDAPYGSTQHVHCLRLEKLHDYVEHPFHSRKLSQPQIERIVRALRAVAGMDKQFGHAEPPELRPALT